jgi:K+-sensing histidine kinase KdpD
MAQETGPEKGWLKRVSPYIESVALVLLIAWAQSMAGHRIEDRAGLTLLEIGTCYGAWRGGLFPGLTALISALLLGAYYMPPARSLGVSDRADVISLFLFLILGLFIVAFGEANRLEKLKVLEREKELRKLNARLAEANVELDLAVKRRTADLQEIREYLADET